MFPPKTVYISLNQPHPIGHVDCQQPTIGTAILGAIRKHAYLFKQHLILYDMNSSTDHHRVQTWPVTTWLENKRSLQLKNFWMFRAINQHCVVIKIRQKRFQG